MVNATGLKNKKEENIFPMFIMSIMNLVAVSGVASGVANGTMICAIEESVQIPFFKW